MIRPIYYKQGDSRWANVSYAVDGETSTIKSAGCGPACLAMVLASIVSVYIDPVTCASWARMKGYKVHKSGTSYNYPTAQATEYGVVIRRLNTSNVYGKNTDFVHLQAWEELQKGNWVLACIGKGLWTNSGHFVIAYGCDSNGCVYINDPASTNKLRTCNTWSLFRSQVKYYWVVEVPEPIKNYGVVKDGEYRQKDFYREVQMCIKAGIDEIPGKQTLSKTVTVSAKKNRKHPVVLPLQKQFKKLGLYTGELDCIVGEIFTSAINSYQRKRLGYKKIDGEITAGKRMWQDILEM